MAFEAEGFSSDQYRIILVSTQVPRVLVAHDGHYPRLPLVQIPKWTRPAEQLTEFVKRQWDLTSIVIDYLRADKDVIACAVFEILDGDWPDTPAGLFPLDLRDICICGLDEAEQITLTKIIAGDTNGRGPFSRIGWLTEARQWLLENLDSRPIHIRTEVMQLNAGATFALVRFSSEEGPAFWLKATGTPNRHEFSLTKQIEQLSPHYLPPIIASRQDWNAWLSQETGHPLSLSPGFEELKQIVIATTELQQAAIGRSEDFLQAGALDHRITILQSRLPQLIEYFEYAMEKQTSTKVPPLDKSCLNKLERLLQHALDAMCGLGIPDTLVHNDLNPGNILINKDHCLFIDWSETCIGPPVLMPEQLYAQLRMIGGERTEWISRLNLLYEEAWRDRVGRQELGRASAMAPAISCVTRLIGKGNRFETRRNDSEFLRYSRSIARHMDRIVHSHEFQEALKS